MILLKKISFVFLILSIALVTQNYAQDNENKAKKVNSPYSPNPVAKKIEKNQTAKNNIQTDTSIEIIETDNAVAKTENTKKVENVTIAAKTREVAKKASKANLSPIEIYKVGVGDVLYINLQDTTAKYYTILVDGTIDYPLAGKLVSVVDLTTDEIEDLLREKVKLYKNPQVTVKVREYSSHLIKVDGLASIGEHYLQREAMPLVVIKTMVGVQIDAKRVSIVRENSEKKVIDLSSSEANTFLIQKGDHLTFENDITAKNQTEIPDTNQYYFAGDNICEGGKKKFHSGITLVQAVFEVCGGLNNKLKEVKIIRKTQSGKFISKRYDYRDILDGKEKDPVLQPNDMIDADK